MLGARYNFNIDFEKPIYMQLSREALSLCISLYLKYVASDSEKEKFKKILIENEIEYKKI